jgi:hypothetical protein
MRKMRYKELEDFSKETQLNRVLSNIRLRPAGASGSSQGCCDPRERFSRESLPHGDSGCQPPSPHIYQDTGLRSVMRDPPD